MGIGIRMSMQVKRRNPDANGFPYILCTLPCLQYQCVSLRETEKERERGRAGKKISQSITLML